MIPDDIEWPVAMTPEERAEWDAELPGIILDGSPEAKWAYRYGRATQLADLFLDALKANA